MSLKWKRKLENYSDIKIVYLELLLNVYVHLKFVLRYELVVRELISGIQISFPNKYLLEINASIAQNLFLRIEDTGNVKGLSYFIFYPTLRGAYWSQYRVFITLKVLD